MSDRLGTVRIAAPTMKTNISATSAVQTISKVP